jgi:prepilin-type N-terminal cleavage/methylation domain-containing protein
MERQHSQGLTLVELLTVMSLLALLITLGVPSMSRLIDTSRLRAAAEGLSASLQLARAETIAHPDPAAEVYLSFRRAAQDDTDWCFGLARGSPCDCRLDDAANADACRLDNGAAARLKRVTSDEFPGVALEAIAFGAGGHTHFDAVRGTAQSGHVLLGNGHTLKLVLSPLGRVRLCSPDAAGLPGYAAC